MSLGLFAFLFDSEDPKGGLVETKQKAQSRRQAVLFAVLGGIFFFTFFKLSFPKGIRQGEPFRSLFFGEVESWPELMKGFAPLELVLACMYLWLMTRLIQLIMESPEDPRDLKGWILFIAGFMAFFGSMGGLIGAVLAGWYTSIEFFLAMGVMLIVILAGFGIAAACLLGLGRVVVFLAEAAWSRIRTTKAAQPLVKFGRYMNADDVHEVPENG